ncbi:PIG-X [Aspergillus avenaceus]|uniref:Protein PBN1 n=1 Tax=Aspergillus avenaceus TaxID=36643 RepID=A0A5N6TWD3_ASPAV|nr:PIG-X [Aspergillus avenaceus]
MRRRITFVQRSDSPFSHDQAILTPDTLTIRSLDAAREDRATFAFDEVLPEIWQVLKHCHQLHIRWASERRYDAVTPFASRVSAGLHVFFTPGSIPGDSLDGLCILLKKVFGDELDCTTPEESFITPPILSTRFASTPTFQYYSSLSSVEGLVSYLENKICGSDSECRAQAERLRSADSVDLNYDSISHSLTVSGFWSRSAEGWSETISKHAAGADQIEIGLLGTERAVEPEEIKMGGLLGVVGRDDQLKPTLFSFPSRHHALPEDATYSVSFPGPTGLHPTMTISLPSSSLNPPPAPPDATCALHSYLTLPSTIFADKYQLSSTDPLFLESHHLVALRAVAGETDLEAPDWSVSNWGSNWLLELATPSDPGQVGEWNVTVPLHLRYLKPSESGYRSASVPWPVVFWACTAEDGTKMGVNPFDRANLGWDGLFGTRTMFYQLHPSADRLVEELEVPVLKLESEGLFQTRMIEVGTVAAIVFGLLWVLWKLGVVARSSTQSEESRQKKAK